jgi:hypothetical protein
MKIVTEHVYPPIPDRSSDWSAVTENYDGPGSPIGWGPTEAAAISDLEEKLDDADEAAELAADMACDACKGTGFVTVSTRTCAYICAGEPPEDARHVAAAICCECHSHHRHGYSYDRQGSRR